MATCRLARFHRTQGRFEEARTLYHQADMVIHEVSSRLEVELGMGLCWWKRGDLTPAALRLLRVQEVPLARAILGHILLERGRIPDALVQLRDAERICSQDRHVLMLVELGRGIALATIGKGDGAWARFEQALSLCDNPIDRVEVLASWAEWLVEYEQFREARGRLSQAREQGVGEGHKRVTLAEARVSSAQGHIQESSSLYHNLLQAGPPYESAALLGLGQAILRGGNPADARQRLLLAQSLSTRPLERMEIALTLAATHRRLNDVAFSTEVTRDVLAGPLAEHPRMKILALVEEAEVEDARGKNFEAARKRNTVYQLAPTPALRRLGRALF